jgi:hypothetical protein
MNTAITVKPTSSRENDFNCPEGDKSQRWEMTFTNKDPLLVEELLEDEDESELTLTVDFTAYGDSADTPLGAIQSFSDILDVYMASYEEYVAYWQAVNIKNLRWENSNISYIEDLRENNLHEVCDHILVPFIQHWKGSKRTSFDLSEIGLIEDYRYIIYGTMNLINVIFNNDENYNVTGFKMFEDMAALKTCVQDNLKQLKLVANA